MYDVANFTLADMSQCGAALRKLGDGAESMEEAADRAVRYLYQQLVDKKTGEKAFALIRLFKTHPYEQLEPGLQAFALQCLGKRPLFPGLKCLTLLATAGDRPEWNSRGTSTQHKAIPLPSKEIVSQFPMITSLIRQFGLEVEALLKPRDDLLLDYAQRTYNVFHVLSAIESPFIPAQEDFVIPFGIQSVMGFGGMLPSNNLFAVIMFSKIPIPRDTADLFKSLALTVKLAILPFEEKVFRA
jgi:hypothetical protein